MAFKLKGWSAFSKPETQMFMGRGQLFNRLTAQVGNRSLAKNILIERGHMNSDGSWIIQEGEDEEKIWDRESAPYCETP